jgi:hypothetical protein
VNMYGVVYRSSGVVRVSSGVCESVWRGVSCLRNINSCIYRQVTPRSEFRTLMIMNDCGIIRFLRVIEIMVRGTLL